MLLIAGDAIARTHGSNVELAAMAVVVAHLDRARETVRRVSTGSGLRLLTGQRVALDVPWRPIQRRFECASLVVRAESEQRRIVHPRRRDDFAGVHAVARIEQCLNLGKRGIEPRAELPRHPLAAAQAVTVLARVRPLVLANHGGSLLGDGAHLRRAAATHIENRAHMQGADAGVRVPGAIRTVLSKNLRQPLGVFLKVLERHRAVLDEGDGLSLAFHRHHDVQSGLAHVPQRFLRLGRGDAHDRVRKA